MQCLNKGWCQIQPPSKQRQQQPSQQCLLDAFIRKYIAMPYTSQVTEDISAECQIKWLWQTRVTYSLQQKKTGMSFSWNHSHIHKIKKVGWTTEHGVTEQLLSCFPLLSICPWEQLIHLFNYYWQYLSHKPCGERAIPVKCLHGVWCGFCQGLFGWFCFFFSKKRKRKKTHKKTKQQQQQPTTTHIRTHGSALQSDPCLYRPQRCSDANQ